MSSRLCVSVQSRGLSPQWVFSARGDYSRAAETLQRAIDYSDTHDPTTARFYNTRIMKVLVLQVLRPVLRCCTCIVS